MQGCQSSKGVDDHTARCRSSEGICNQQASVCTLTKPPAFVSFARRVLHGRLVSSSHATSLAYGTVVGSVNRPGSFSCDGTTAQKRSDPDHTDLSGNI